jgi:hypothetical protein
VPLFFSVSIGFNYCGAIGQLIPDDALDLVHEVRDGAPDPDPHTSGAVMAPYRGW